MSTQPAGAGSAGKGAQPRCGTWEGAGQGGGGRRGPRRALRTGALKGEGSEAPPPQSPRGYLRAQGCPVGWSRWDKVQPQTALPAPCTVGRRWCRQTPGCLCYRPSQGLSQLGCRSATQGGSGGQHLFPIEATPEGTSPGCLQALFRRGTYPGSFNPRPDGKSCWHCWQREGPQGFVPLLERTSQQVPGWGGSFIPPPHGMARANLPAAETAITNKGSCKEETRRLPAESWTREGSRHSCLVRVHLGSTKEDRRDPPGKGPS